MQDVNTASVPVKIRSLFVKTSDVHSYNTRSSSSSNFDINASKLKVQRNAFSRIGARVWNEISCTLRELPGRSFKAEIKNSLLSTLN